MTDAISLNAVRAARTGDNRHMTPADTLRDALADIESGDLAAGKLMVLHITDHDDDSFDTGWYAANMKSSEMIALMEMVKATLLRDMGLT